MEDLTMRTLSIVSLSLLTLAAAAAPADAAGKTRKPGKESKQSKQSKQSQLGGAGAEPRAGKARPAAAEPPADADADADADVHVDGALPPEPASAPARTRTLGLDAGIAAPVGDLGDAIGFGIGALGRFEMPLGGALHLTARAGYVQHLEKEADAGGLGGAAKSSVGELLLFGGVRYAFSETPTSQIYGAAELGFVNYRVRSEYGGESMSSSSTNLGMTLGAGYRTGKLDLRAGLFFPDAGELTDAMAVMATAGFDLTSF